MGAWVPAEKVTGQGPGRGGLFFLTRPLPAAHSHWHLEKLGPLGTGAEQAQGSLAAPRG